MQTRPACRITPLPSHPRSTCLVSAASYANKESLHAVWQSCNWLRQAGLWTGSRQQVPRWDEETGSRGCSGSGCTTPAALQQNLTAPFSPPKTSCADLWEESGGRVSGYPVVGAPTVSELIRRLTSFILQPILTFYNLCLALLRVCRH